MATMKKKITPMIHAKTKFHDRALSCGNQTFPPYDCPVILQRGGVTLHFQERGVPKTKPPFQFPKFEVMTHKKDTEYSGAFCTSTLILTFVDSNKSMRSVIFFLLDALMGGCRVLFSFNND